MKRLNIIRKTTIILLGLAFSAFVTCQLYDFATPIQELIAAFVVLILWGTGLAYLIVDKIILSRLGNCTARVWVIWSFSSLIAGLMLVYYIPLTIYPKLNYLSVVATGEKNPDSNGSEVWLESIVTGRRATSQELDDLCSGEGWEARDNLMVSFQNQPSELNCILKTDEFMMVRFNKHTWSGKAQVIYNNKSSEVDLFSDETGTQELIRLQVELGTPQNIIRFLLWFAGGTWFGLLILAAGIWFTSRPVSLPIMPDEQTTPWYVYALPMTVIYLFVLFAFWPGLVSFDGLRQWGEILSGKITDWHPGFHTFTIWLFTRIWNTPASVTLFQILYMTSIMGWGLRLIHRWEAPRLYRRFVLIYLCTSPAVALMSIAIWKDTLYSMSVVFLTLMVFQVVVTNGSWLKKPVAWVAFGIVASLVALYRHNGTLVAFGTITLLVLVTTNYRKYLLGALLVSVGIWLVIRGPLYQATDVSTAPEDYGKNLAPQYNSFYLIIWHHQNDTQFSPEESDFYNRIPSRNDKQKVKDFLYANQDMLLQLAVNLSVRNPYETFQYFLTKFSFILQVAKPSIGRIEYIEPQNPPNEYGLDTAPKLPLLRDWIVEIARITEQPGTDWFFWRNAFWMYLLLFASIIACLRTKKLTYLLIPIPVLLNALPYIALTGGHMSRYIFSTLVISPLLSGYLLWVARPQSSDHQPI